MPMDLNKRRGVDKVNNETFSRRPNYSLDLAFSRETLYSSQPVLPKEHHLRVKREQEAVKQKLLGGGDNVFKIPIAEENISNQFLLSCILGGIFAVGIYKFVEYRNKLA